MADEAKAGEVKGEPIQIKIKDQVRAGRRAGRWARLNVHNCLSPRRKGRGALPLQDGGDTQFKVRTTTKFDKVGGRKISVFSSSRASLLEEATRSHLH